MPGVGTRGGWTAAAATAFVGAGRRGLLLPIRQVLRQLAGFIDNLGRLQLRLLQNRLTLLLRGGEGELGVNGNFAFAVAFLGAWNYFAQIFGIEVKASQGEELAGASDVTMSEPEETERQEA